MIYNTWVIMEPSDNTMNDVLETIKTVSIITSVGIIKLYIKVSWGPSQYKDTIW